MHENTDVESDQESWTGIASPSSSAAPADQREHEYSDEEQLATVTVVEDFDPSAILHFSTTTPDAEQQQQQQRPLLTPPLSRPRPPSLSREKASRNDGGLVAKNVKVRYETKAARKATRATQRARRTEKAERAGGKAARKKGGGNKSRARKK
jgi:ribosomal RNA-processing protein 17